MGKQSFKETLRIGHPRIYRLAKRMLSLNVPACRLLYIPLRYERSARHLLWDRIASMFYYEPLFKTLCRRCGDNLRLIGGLPQVYGNLTIELEDHVTLHGTTSLCGGKVFQTPTLTVGANSHLGYQLTIYVGDRVDIGRHVLVADRVHIFGYDAHPRDPYRRAADEPPDATGCGTVTIEDHCWVGAGSCILKNVRIGRGSIIGAGAVVTGDVPAYSVVAGNPGRIVASIEGYSRSRETAGTPDEPRLSVFGSGVS